MHGDQRSTIRSSFSPSTRSPEGQTQVISFTQQVFLPTELSQWPSLSCFKFLMSNVYYFNVLMCKNKTVSCMDRPCWVTGVTAIKLDQLDSFPAKCKANFKTYSM